MGKKAHPLSPILASLFLFLQIPYHPPSPYAAMLQYKLHFFFGRFTAAYVMPVRGKRKHRQKHKTKRAEMLPDGSYEIRVPAPSLQYSVNFSHRNEV